MDASMTDDDEDRVRLVCLCASHVDSMVRLACLRDMLRSWCGQRPGPPLPLYLALSVGAALEPRVVLRALEPWTTQVVGAAAAADQPLLRIVLQDGGDPPATPLARVAALVTGGACLPEETAAAAAGGPPVWLLFAEDGDIWHPDRVETYRSTIVEDVLAAGPQGGDAACVSVQAHASPVGAGVLPPGGASAHTVDAALLAGAAADGGSGSSSSSSTAPDCDVVRGHRAQPRHFEWWMLSCSLAAFRAFVASAGPAVLAHPLADVFLVRHLRHTPGRRIHEVDPDAALPTGWAVARRRGPGAWDRGPPDAAARVDRLIVLCGACGAALPALAADPAREPTLRGLLGGVDDDEDRDAITAAVRAVLSAPGAAERYRPFFVP